jgi:hypothetical protein
MAVILAFFSVVGTEKIPCTPLTSLCAIFVLFPLLKKPQKLWQHTNIEAIQAAATMELTAISKEAFTTCFQDLQKHWQQCSVVTMEGLL